MAKDVDRRWIWRMRRIAVTERQFVFRSDIPSPSRVEDGNQTKEHGGL
jgi:hypothetical protein